MQIEATKTVELIAQEAVQVDVMEVAEKIVCLDAEKTVQLIA